MSETAKRQFVRHQGFVDASPSSCGVRYPALLFQPRVLGVLFLLAILFQSAAVFLILAGILWWSALVPSRNPLDLLYKRCIAARRNLVPLTPAPGPRRFAQALAGTLMAAAGLAIIAGRPRLAWLFEGMLTLAVGGLVFGRFCLGSYLFHLLRGERSFAHRTLPWSRRE